MSTRGVTLLGGAAFVSAPAGRAGNLRAAISVGLSFASQSCLSTLHGCKSCTRVLWVAKQPGM